MDDARFAPGLRTRGGGVTRRRMLTAMAALAGLHAVDATAKRRRRRKTQAQAQAQVSATPPTMLVIDSEKPGGPFIGTFEASGAFVDEGTFLVVESLITGTQSELLLNNHLTYEFTGAGDTFQLTSQNRITFGAPESAVAGHWRVTGGTGDYAGLRGAGSLEGTLDAEGIFHLTFTGRVQLA
jgi:hypothetical protein